MLLLAGRFEGIDQRVIEGRGMREVSIGDYVLAGGEVAAMVLIEAGVRLCRCGRAPRLARTKRASRRGCSSIRNTRARASGKAAHPDVLLSGDHKKIAEWRRRELEKQARASADPTFGLHEKQTRMSAAARVATAT